MKILFLGPPEFPNYTIPLVEYLKNMGDEVIYTGNIINLQFVKRHKPAFIISYGYKHIIKKEILSNFQDKAINLHISLLPWNRGADPNFWSFYDNTPKGVTIHYIDEGLDTGDIIVQKRVVFNKNENLSITYGKLQKEIQSLFKENWQNIKRGNCNKIKQNDKGSFHTKKDLESLKHLLLNGWDTLIDYVEQAASKKLN